MVGLRSSQLKVGKRGKGDLAEVKQVFVTDLLEELVVQLGIMNRHLASMTGEVFTKEDTDDSA